MTTLLKSNKLFLAVTATLLGATLLSGCSNSESSGTTGAERTISHVWGETPIKGTPKKVVTLEFSFVDELYALGVTPVGSAGTGDIKLPEYLVGKVKDFTYVGERKEPSLELIDSTHPDLILASVDRHKMIKNELEEIAPTIGWDDDSYREVLKNTMTLGELLGKEAEAKKVKADLEAKISDVKSKVQGKPKVLVVGAYPKDFTVWIKGSFIGSLLSDIGTDYAYKGSERVAELATVSMDELAKIDPEYLFVYGQLNVWKNNPTFQNMKAVKNNKVLEVDRSLWSRGRGPIAASLILDQAQEIFTK